MPKLTKKIVDQLTLPAKGQKFVWDDELKGFGIRLTPGGKSYFVQARVGGVTRRTTIGKHGVFTAKQARDEAEDKLREMSKGIDPVQKKKAEKAAKTTLNDVAESYIRDRTLKQSSIRDIHKHLNGVFSEWKDEPITKITRDDCLSLFRKRSEESPSQANQAFRVLRALLNYAIETFRHVITENPVQVLSGAKIWNTIKPKKRKIPIAEVGRAWCKLEEIKADPTLGIAGRSMVDAVMFCLFTGCRWGEAQKLKWDNVHYVLTAERQVTKTKVKLWEGHEVDLLDAGSWFIEDPKTDAVTLPLSTQAADLLENRFRIENNPYVFCSEKSKTGYIGPGRYVTDQLAATLEIELSAHDLRRTFRAIAAELDVELWRTKLLMNHKMKNDVTLESYTEKEDLEYLRPSIQAIGSWIELKAREHKAKVVDINSKRQVG